MAIRNDVDKYVIAKHYHQLMPLSMVKPQALPSGYAQGQIKICICLQAIPQAIYSTIFDLRGYAWGYASGNFLKILKFFEI
ncbi:hypothetical protein T12_3225 [Trichinella patagoniensis]|uniref:Uncharacterized protein n=1 Tax=Trichinella patagoniensis TaxID=990121 RepID=A0A0V0ZU23_9BILA|nr:hypothetical protein T12_3225 [Trichinella patagoniensis]